MKNLFRFGFLALTLSLMAIACTPKNNSAATDTTAVDTTIVDTTATDTTKATDTVVKADTTKAAPATH